MKIIIKIILFICIFILIFNAISRILNYAGDYKVYHFIRGFYEEKEETLDAVYLGSSKTYAFWNPLVAWENYGINVYPYTFVSQPIASTKHLIIEARKTQPNALFIVNINGIALNDIYLQAMHQITTYMPFSLNKLSLIDYLCDIEGYSLEERIEFYLPIIRYHSRWNDLNKEDFRYNYNGLKGVSLYEWYLGKITNIEEQYIVSDKRKELSEKKNKVIDDLLDYCDKENVNVLFVGVPCAEENETAVEEINSLSDKIISRGYTVLNLMDKYEDIGINLEKDYYNRPHTNIHGSIKFTNYLAEYLVENYSFENKKDDEEYSSWNDAIEKYKEYINPYVIDIEINSKYRDYNLSQPNNISASFEEEINIKWETVEGAEGYVIYKKESKESPWQRIGTSSKTIYTDNNYKMNETYYYTVVPYRTEEKESCYGEFDYNGVSISIK